MNATHTARLLAAALVLPAALAAQQAAPRPLSLGDAVRLAARQSALVQTAALRTAQAEARVSETRSAFLPSLTAGATEAQTTLNSATFGFNFPAQPGQPPFLNPLGQIIGPVATFDVRAHAAQTIFDPSAFGRLHASQAGAAAVGAGQGVAAEQAAAMAAAAYVQAQRADAQLSARLADSSLAVDLLGIAQAQLSAGVGVALDVTRAESQLAGVKAQLIAARNTQARARLDLARALNLPLDTPLDLTDSLSVLDSVPDASDVDAAVAGAMRQRPDVRALESQLRAAQAQITAIRDERLPAVNAFGNGGYIGLRLSRMLATYTWGVELSVPVLDGNRRDARVTEQEAAMRELAVREADLRQQVTVDVRSAALDLGSARQAVDAARERVRLAGQEVSQARDRFKAGVAGNADVITASLSLNAARTQLIDAETAYQAARVEVARAEGRTTSLR
ncbi:MAG: TolC family protein [Gemmatimonadota bacterium]|nr:TolC family protein [Gemmatimonadota bacterium]MDE3215852.1 TolC family protein [Gemmatimonadota bacterium]